MSSSISSSEAIDPRWRGFAPVFVATTALLLAATLGFLAALDPYDTGRLGLVQRAGVPEQGPRTADASRGRDPRFDSAIIGNSHAQLLRPETLKGETGLDFVSLTVPGTYPKEQFVLTDWFLRHHPSPAAIVFGLDSTWCFDFLNNGNPFPFWLYDRSSFAYVSGLLRFSALEHVPGSLALLLGKTNRARPDGYHNYSEDYRRYAGLPGVQLSKNRPKVSMNPRNDFPAVERLKTVLSGLSPSTRVVLAWPPVHVGAQPAPGSLAEATMNACHAAYAALAAERADTVVVDWAVDRPETRIDENFYDSTHYRDEIAGAFQRDVSDALNLMK
jgi:hypothetical protein